MADQEEKTKQGKLFRKAALDRLSSPEQLHTLMRVTNAKGWLALVGCALIIVTAVVWGVLGTVQSKETANGILLGGAGLTEITSTGDGELKSIDVKVGDTVKKGQIVARIAQPALEQQIANQKQRLGELNADAQKAPLSASSQGRQERLKNEIETLEKTLAENAELVSTVDGKVVEVRAMTGEHVSAGGSIVAIEVTSEGPLQVLLYFDAQTGKGLKPGMTIEIVPSTVRKERYGVMLGRVRSVESYPSTRAGMIGALHNEQLVAMFLQTAGGAPIAVRAELIADKTTPSGYRWSSGAGPDVLLTSGTQCQAAVITRTHRPIALVFPALDYDGS